MTGTKLKVTVLYDLWEEEPAEVQEEVPAPRKRKGQTKRKKKPVTARSRRNLRSFGKARSRAVVLRSRRPPAVTARTRQMWRPISSSTLRSPMRGDDTKEMQVTAFLDMHRYPLHRLRNRTRTCLRRTNRSPRRCSLLRNSSRPTSRHPICGTIDHAHDISFPAHR